ncbi:MAG: hypothetical protein WBG36_00770 [Ornithinimicrobium sp.]
MTFTKPIGALEDHAPFLSATTFRLLAIAVPVAETHIEQEQARLRRMLHGESERLEAEWGSMARHRWQAQPEQHTASLTAGLWRIHLLCGADSEADTAQVAALWASVASGPGPAAYRLAPASTPGALQDAVSATLTAQDPFGLTAPFVAGSDTLATVCRPPLAEVPGVQARSVNPFDVATSGVGEVEFGQVLDVAKTAVGPMRVPLSSLGKHTFVHGATGAGKSQATRHLLTEFSRLGIPWVVLEPAKREYADGMQQRLAALSEEIADPDLRTVHVIRPGDPHATPVGLNPLQPEDGFAYQPHLDTLVDLMVAAFDADSPFPEVLAQGIMTAVRDAGWDPALTRPIRAVEALYADGERPAYPDVADLVRACHDVIDAKGYGREVAGNVHGFVDMRLATLTTGTKRAAFTSGYPLSLTKVLQRNVVLELQDLGSDADRALYMGLFLARLSQAVRVRHGLDPQEVRLRNVVVVEEAHRLLRNPEGLEGAPARAVESFTDLLAEVRSQGVGPDHCGADPPQDRPGRGQEHRREVYGPDAGAGRSRLRRGSGRADRAAVAGGGVLATRGLRGAYGRGRPACARTVPLRRGNSSQWSRRPRASGRGIAVGVRLLRLGRCCQSARRCVGRPGDQASAAGHALRVGAASSPDAPGAAGDQAQPADDRGPASRRGHRPRRG